MKKQNIQNINDERVSAQRHKVYNEAWVILMTALLASILIQQFLLNASFEQYAAEAICFFGVSIYIVIRYLVLGLNVYGEGKMAKSIPFINGIVAGIVVTAINGVLNYTQYADRYKEDGLGYFFAVLAITFISATIGSFSVLFAISYINKKKQDKIKKLLDEEENAQ